MPCTRPASDIPNRSSATPRPAGGARQPSRRAARICGERVRRDAGPGGAVAPRHSHAVGLCRRGPEARVRAHRTSRIHSRATSDRRALAIRHARGGERVEQRYDFATGELPSRFRFEGEAPCDGRRRDLRQPLRADPGPPGDQRRDECRVRRPPARVRRTRLDTRDVAERETSTPGDEEPAVDGALWWSTPGALATWHRVLTAAVRARPSDTPERTRRARSRPSTRSTLGPGGATGCSRSPAWCRVSSTTSRIVRRYASPRVVVTSDSRSFGAGTERHGRSCGRVASTWSVPNRSGSAWPMRRCSTC